MAFSAHEVRVLRRALAVAVRSGRDSVDFWLLGRAIGEAQDERERLRAFMTAELRRYRAALPGSAATFLSCLRNAVDEVAHVPSAEDLAALRSTLDLPCGERERASRVALLSRCTRLAEADLERRLAARAHRRAAAAAVRATRTDPLDILIPTRPRPATQCPMPTVPPESEVAPEPARAATQPQAAEKPAAHHEHFAHPEAEAPAEPAVADEAPAARFPSDETLEPEAADPAAAEGEGPDDETPEGEAPVSSPVSSPASASAELEAVPHQAPAEETANDEPSEHEAPAPRPVEPEAIQPEATEPEATEPQATEPEATEPEATEPEMDATTDRDTATPAPAASDRAREILSPVIPHRRQGRVLGQLPAPEVLQTGTG